MPLVPIMGNYTDFMPFDCPKILAPLKNRFFWQFQQKTLASDSARQYYTFEDL
jgi:hypothetical protein